MRSEWLAAKMMWTLHRENTSTLNSPETVQLDIKGERHDVDIYEPAVTYRGTIAVIHGMSPKGKSDPRIMTLCQALSQIGFRVVAPDIASIKALIIDPAQIESIADIVNVIASSTTLTPSGRLALLAPSFSGAMCLAAAALPCVNDKIASICAIGAFTEVDSVINYLLTNNTADPYGRYIVLKNVLPLILQDDTAIQKALDAAIKDNLNEESNVELQHCLFMLTAEEQAQVNRVFHDGAYRTQLFQSSRPIIAEELKAMNIVSRLEGLSAKVFLLHGKHDNVIPCDQSEMLYGHLKQREKEVDLVVTPFISHGDTDFSYKRIPDLLNVINGFAYFFDDLKTAH